MSQISLPYIFQNQTTADANQVDQNFNAIVTVVNGNLDDTNIKAGSLSASIAKEGVTPSQTKGIPYAADLFGGSFVLNGFTVTKDGSIQNQIDVSQGVAYILQSDGSLRRIVPPLAQGQTQYTFRTSSANATYYLDLNPDGTWSFTTGHSTQTGYINIATVTTDASGNVSTITQNTNAYKITLLGNATGPVSVQGMTSDPFSSISFWINS